MTSFAAAPAPLRDEEFALFKRGISDDPAIDVYLNARADFAVLSADPLSCEADAIKDIVAATTVVGGRVVFAR